MPWQWKSGIFISAFRHMTRYVTSWCAFRVLSTILNKWRKHLRSDDSNNNVLWAMVRSWVFWGACLDLPRRSVPSSGLTHLKCPDRRSLFYGLFRPTPGYCTCIDMAQLAIRQLYRRKEDWCGQLSAILTLAGTTTGLGLPLSPWCSAKAYYLFKWLN